MREWTILWSKAWGAMLVLTWVSSPSIVNAQAEIPNPSQPSKIAVPVPPPPPPSPTLKPGKNIKGPIEKKEFHQGLQSFILDAFWIKAAFANPYEEINASFQRALELFGNREDLSEHQKVRQSAKELRALLSDSESSEYLRARYYGSLLKNYRGSTPERASEINQLAQAHGSYAAVLRDPNATDAQKAMQYLSVADKYHLLVKDIPNLAGPAKRYKEACAAWSEALSTGQDSKAAYKKVLDTYHTLIKEYHRHVEGNPHSKHNQPKASDENQVITEAVKQVITNNSKKLSEYCQGRQGKECPTGGNTANTKKNRVTPSAAPKPGSEEVVAARILDPVQFKKRQEIVARAMRDFATPDDRIVNQARFERFKAINDRAQREIKELERLKTQNSQKQGNPVHAVTSQELSRAVGLKNFGASCYLNSIIKYFQAIPGSYELLLNQLNTLDRNAEKNQFRLAFSALLVALKNREEAARSGIVPQGGFTPLDPLLENLRDAFNRLNVSQQINLQRQSDARLFLDYFLGALGQYSQTAEPAFFKKHRANMPDLTLNLGETLEKELQRYPEMESMTIKMHTVETNTHSHVIPETYPENGPAKFQLKSVIRFLGTSGAGHYITYTYNEHEKAWYVHNDTDVHKLTPDELQRAKEAWKTKGSNFLYTKIKEPSTQAVRKVPETWTLSFLPSHI